MRPLLLLLLLALGATTARAAGRPMTVDDLLAVKTVGDPQVSPDGKAIVYVVSEIDREADRSNSSLWLVPAAGGPPRRLTTTPGTNTHPRWSPDGKTIAFVSGRGGSPQVWLLPVDGGEPRQLTKLPIGVGGPIWSPTGEHIAFAAEVYPGTTPEETARRDKEKAEAKSKALVYDSLMVRHWDHWDEGKRSHLFVCDAATGAARDLTPDLKSNTPPAPFGGSNDYAFAPDGKSLAFTVEPQVDRAWSTNSDIWLVPVTGGAARNLTAKNRAADAQPAFSPDGKLLAYVSQARAGFESDRWVLTVLPLEDGATPQPLSAGLDRPIQAFAWKAGGDAGSLVAIIDDKGTEPIVEIAYTASGAGASRKVVAAGEPRRLVEGATHGGLQVSGPDAPLVFLRHDAAHPAEVHRADADGKAVQNLTEHNADLVATLDLPKAELFSFKGANGDPVQGWLVRPPGFDASKTYPVLFLIHGGPQGAWHDEWHARWNYALFAAPGYAVVAVNPRGSTGFGQRFTDQISGDWTGRVLDDLNAGLDFALKTYPFLDGDRVAAAGGSYGGFMVNWLAGHSDRFKALISHAGVFDLSSKYGATEELFFPEWEFGGPPWEKPELYREMSPSEAVANFKTPTLVIHGALDYRVVDTQGLAMFTSLQRRGVPSRLLYFPDEGHWILRPANRVSWWNEMHRWLATYLKPAAN
jgi:dipeptidyl aminopeptidase/acylaminoacyl peptidase